MHGTGDQNAEIARLADELTALRIAIGLTVDHLQAALDAARAFLLSEKLPVVLESELTLRRVEALISADRILG